MRIKKPIAAVLFFIAIAACSDQEIIIESTVTSSEALITATSVIDDCSLCTFVVPPKTHVVDGTILKLAPGSVIGLDANTTYGNLLFRNIVGTPEQPIRIRNCNGKATINATNLSFGLKTEASRHFRISGGDALRTYGILINGGHIGVSFDKLSSQFEVDHLEIQHTGFAGLMAKTDPTCDDATIRGNFTMTNVSIHDNYVHDTSGEGFYIGNSFYQYGKTLTCGVRLPHEIHYLRLYNNIVKNSGWDGIQVGSATRGAKIYGNTVENYGLLNKASQRSGIQLGEGTGGVCYGNLVSNGLGNGITILGLGDNVIHNNIVVNAGHFGMFCDERFTPGSGFKFINNTILNPAADGIRVYAEKVTLNVVINNIIVNPGSYSTYVYPRTGNDAFIYKLGASVPLHAENNLLTQDISDIGFADTSTQNYRLLWNSPAVDNGSDISAFRINTDFYKKARLKGIRVDIGAAEY